MLRKVVVLSSALLLLGATSAMSQTAIDLLTLGSTVVQGDGSVWQQFVSAPTGTGNYQPFERLQAQGNSGVEEGFNNDLKPSPLDTDHAWTMSIQMNTLTTFVSDGSGAVPAGSYYVFTLDMNEPNPGGSDPERLLSLDEFQLFTDNTSNISGGLTDLQTNATLRYDMDAGADYYVALDHSLAEGSGHDDMIVYIPTSYFVGSVGTDYLYLYSQFGLQGGGYEASDGFEEWKVARSVPVVPPDIPEPTTMVLLGSGLAGFVGRRLRRK